MTDLEHGALAVADSGLQLGSVLALHLRQLRPGVEQSRAQLGADLVPDSLGSWRRERTELQSAPPVRQLNPLDLAARSGLKLDVHARDRGDAQGAKVKP